MDLGLSGAACSAWPMRTRLIDQLIAQRPAYRFEHLKRQQAERVLHGVLALLFPHFVHTPYDRAELLAVSARVEADLTELLAAVGIQDGAAAEIIDAFFDKLGPGRRMPHPRCPVHRGW